MRSEALFESALGMISPWYVRGSAFDAEARTLTICVDFRSGGQFSYPDAAGEHSVRPMLKQWYTKVMRAKAELMKPVATMIRGHLGGALLPRREPD